MDVLELRTVPSQVAGRVVVFTDVASTLQPLVFIQRRCFGNSRGIPALLEKFEATRRRRQHGLARPRRVVSFMAFVSMTIAPSPTRSKAVS